MKYHLITIAITLVILALSYPAAQFYYPLGTVCLVAALVFVIFRIWKRPRKTNK